MRKQAAAATQVIRKTVLAVLPPETSDALGQKHQGAAPPPRSRARRERQVSANLQEPPSFPSKRALRPNLQPHCAFPRACGHWGHGRHHAFHADQAAVRPPSIGRCSAHDPDASARSGRVVRLGAH